MDNSPAIPFNTESLDEADKTRPVTMFSVLAIPLNPPVLVQGKKLVHWRIQLRWSDLHPYTLAHRSVCLDTQRMSRNDSRVEVEIASRRKVVSEYVEHGLYWLHNIEVVREGLTVQRVIDLLVGLSRNRYRYDEDGNGCLLWTTTILEDFKRQGWITQQDLEEFNSFVEETRTEEKDAYWIPKDKGSFF